MEVHKHSREKRLKKDQGVGKIETITVSHSNIESKTATI
jgi:hypothetical protein